MDGDAAWTGPAAPNGMVITYYQRTRHLFGKLKLEVLDEGGKLVDTLPASKRPGINRVNWSMNVKPPRVPPAASVAGSATQGPRGGAGDLHRAHDQGGQDLRDQGAGGLDPALLSPRPTRSQFDAAMKVHAMFGEMSDLVAQIIAARQGPGQVLRLPESDPRARVSPRWPTRRT